MITLTASVKTKHTKQGLQYQYFINDQKVRTSYRIYTNACAVIDHGEFSGILCCGNFNTCYRACLDRVSLINRHKQNDGYYKDQEVQMVTFPKIEA